VYRLDQGSGGGVRLIAIVETCLRKVCFRALTDAHQPPITLPIGLAVGEGISARRAVIKYIVLVVTYPAI
jgi:hypothetical protein